MTLDNLASWGSVLGTLAALWALAWSAVQYILVRREEIRQRRFENLQRLVKIFAGREDRDPPALAAQLAAAFEFRFYPEYLTLFEVLAVDHHFSGNPQADAIQRELDNSIAEIRKRTRSANHRKGNWSR